MNERKPRWILAFDASCGKCRALSHAVASASEERLEVLSLADLEVRDWRRQSLGGDAAWTPTLLRIDAAGARAWTGVGLGVMMARLLGVRATVRVLRVLGQKRSRSHRSGGFRQQLQVVAGLAMLAGMVMTTSPGGGRTPHGWVEANRDRLPKTYDEISTHPVARRRAIFDALEPEVKSRLWTDHLKRYRSSHPGLSSEQVQVIERALAVIPRAHEAGEGRTAEFDELAQAADRAFGRAEAGAVLASLGPVTTEEEVAGKERPDCACSNASDYCDSGSCLGSTDCNEQTSGCGTGWSYRCDGLCGG